MQQIWQIHLQWPMLQRSSIPGERNCTNRQKALAAEIDVTHMAEPTLVPDATKVVDQGTTKRIPAKRKSRNSQKGDTVEARSKKKSKQKLVSSSACSVNPPGVARDSEALNVAPATLVADELVVTSEGRSICTDLRHAHF